MANSRNCGCYGALGCVAGPLQCAYVPADPSDYQNFPFYNGPCAPGPYPTPAYRSCPACRHCQSFLWEDDLDASDADQARVSCTQQPVSMFVSAAPLRLQAGKGISFQPAVVNRNLFFIAENGIRLRHSGTYLATYTVNLPPQQAANTRFSLLLDENEVVGSAQNLICPPNSASSVSICGQAIVQAAPNNLLSLVSENDLNMICADGNPVTLTLLRI